MKKQVRNLIAVLTAFAMVITICGCGAAKAATEETFEGELVDAQVDRIVVKNMEETMLFVTTEGTAYDLQDEEELCVGDQVKVKYHKGDDSFIADTIDLKTHEEKSLVFGGKVTELEPHYITVRSESLTAGFDYDENTKIQGNLSKGDAVTITYDGNLSERPRAISIVVIQEQREESLKSIHGTVSEIAKTSVFISIDSADACRFVLTEDTIINGDDVELKVGDDVNVVYTGTIGQDPVARTITVRRDKAQTYYVMDGVIEQVKKDSLVISTKENAYSFSIVDETRIQNPDYMKPNHKATITYAGKLKKDPVAASIYCSKETISKKQKAKKETKVTKASDPTKDTEATDPTEDTEATDPTEDTEATDPTKDTDPTEDTEATDPTEDTEATDPTEDTEATDPTEETDSNPPEPEPEDVIIKATGEISSWGNPCTIKIDGGGTVELDISDAAISGGYIPQEDDQVVFVYEKDDMKLLDLQLAYRPPMEEE